MCNICYKEVAFDIPTETRADLEPTEGFDMDDFGLDISEEVVDE